MPKAGTVLLFYSIGIQADKLPGWQSAQKLSQDLCNPPNLGKYTDSVYFLLTMHRIGV